MEQTKLNTPLISVSNQRGTNDTFDVTSVGFDTEKRYTVAEFNQALKKANEIWKEGWNGLSYPHDIAIVTVENLHTEPCTYRINLADVDYGSIQDIVRLSPTPMHASISTDEALERLNKAETIPQQRDISNKTNSTGKTGERQENMANTPKLECTGMVMFDGDSKAKAVATVTVNDEFVIKGIKVYEGKNGLFASMPSRKVGSEYQDVIFPITAEARQQLNSAVLETYGKLAESGLDKLPLENRKPPEQSTSKITVSLHQISDDAKATKAVGQIVIDDSIVVSGVKVRHGTNADGVEKDFVSMPSYQTQTGEYNEYAHAVTQECYNKINKAVMKAYETLQKTEYKGVKFSELGEKGEISTKFGMNSVFAKKLMAELDKKGIPYSAKLSETTTLSIKTADKAEVDKTEKALSASLSTEKKKPEQEQIKPKKTR